MDVVTLGAALNGSKAYTDQVTQSIGTEIAQARVGADGTSYQTLKARLDGENSELKEDLSELDENVGIYDIGTFYNSLNPTFNQTAVFYPIKDVNSTFYYSISNKSTNGALVIRITSRISVTQASNLQTVTTVTSNDTQGSGYFEIPDEIKEQAKYIAILNTTAGVLVNFNFRLYTNNSLAYNVFNSEQDIENLISRADVTEQKLTHLTPNNFTEDISIPTEYIERIENTRIPAPLVNQPLSTSTTSKCLLLKIDLSFVDGEIYNLVPYIKGTYGQSFNYAIFTLCDENNIVIYNNFPIEDRYVKNVNDIYSVHIDKIKTNFINARYLYIGMEYETEVSWYYSKPKLPSWFPKGITETEKEQIEFNNKVIIPDVQLPFTSVAVVGHEWNLYFEQICPDYNSFGVWVNVKGMPSGMKLTDKYLRYTPTSSDIGSRTVTLEFVKIGSPYESIKTATFTFYVVADSSPTTSVMYIGDSLTDLGYYPAEIQANLSGGKLTSVGTRTKTVTINGEQITVNHEGRSGWLATDYVNPETRTGHKDAVNPFINPTTNKFDFAYYISSTTVTAPSIVMLNLGTNDTTQYTHIENTISALEEMITSIHAYDSNIKIFISLFSNTAYHANYNFVTRAIMIRESYKENFKNRDGEKIYLTEPYIAVDPVNDYAKTTQNASARNTTQVEVFTDNLHPAISGFLHFADVYYNNILLRNN